jgi:DNA-binding FrmR family transcriptional regulator
VVKIAQKDTFDVSTTPKVGKQVAARDLSPIDLDRLRTDMAATIEKAKADDPKLLRARIFALERDLKKGHPAPAGKPAAVPAKATGPRREDIATINALRKALEEAMKFIIEINAKDFIGTTAKPANAQIEKAITEATQTVKKMIERHLDQRNKELDALRLQGQRVINRLKGLLDDDVTIKVDVRHNEPFTVSPSASARAPRMVSGPGTDLPPAERKFLTALAQQARPLTRNQVAIFAGYSTASGHVDNTLGALRAAGYAVGGRDGITITDAGLAALGTFDPLPTGEDLRAYWIRELEPAASKFLAVLCEIYPSTIERDELATRAGYSPQSGHVDNTLGRLRSLELATGGRASIKASENLFG